MRILSKLATALVATLVATTASGTAKAEGSPSVDWMRLLTEMDTVARRGADVIDSPRCGAGGCQTVTNATAAPAEHFNANRAHATGREWFGLAPRFSLVARDWSSAYKVAGAGDRLALIDELRLTSSTRMVLTRIRVNESRISPFAQVGLGQWRTDPYLLPLSTHFEQIAAQAEGGFELRLVGTWQVALESSLTMLYRESRAEGIPATQVWSTTFASRVDF